MNSTNHHETDEQAAARLYADLFVKHCMSGAAPEDADEVTLIRSLQEIIPEAKPGTNLARLFTAFAAGVEAGIDLTLRIENAAKAARSAEQ